MLEISIVQLFLLVPCGSDEATIAVFLNEVLDDDPAVCINADVGMAYSVEYVKASPLGYSQIAIRDNGALAALVRR